MATHRSNSDEQAAKVLRGGGGRRTNENAWRSKPASEMTGTQQQAAKILGIIAPEEEGEDEDEE